MLQKQNAPLQFRGGIDSKTDAKAVLPGKLLLLENATFDNPGRLNKRNGYEALDREVEGRDAITDAQGLVSYKDELLAFDKRNVYSRSEATDSWVWKGFAQSTTVERERISGAEFPSTEPDAAQHPNGLRAVVWRNADAIRYSILDSASGQKIVSSRVLVSGAGLGTPRVVCAGNQFVFYVVSATKALRIGLLPVADPNETITFTDILSYSAGSTDSLDVTAPNYAVACFSGGIFLAFNNDAVGGGTTLKKFSAVAPLTLLGTVGVNYDSGYGLDVFEDRFTGGPVIVHSATDDIVRYWAYASNIIDGGGGAALLGSGSSATLPDPAYFPTGISRSANEIDLVFFWSTPDFSSPNSSFAEHAVVTGSYSFVMGEAVFLRSVNVAGRAFAVDGVAYVPLAHEGAERSVFVADDQRNIVAKALTGAAQTLDPTGFGAFTSLPSTYRVNDTTFGFAALEQPRTDGVTDVQADPTFGVSCVDVNLFDSMKAYQSAEISDVLYLGGGITQMYDGVSVVEAGFLTAMFPPGLTGGGGAGNTYQYVAVPEWVDARGYRHFGAPSLPAAVTQTNPVAPGDAVVLGITPVCLTAKRPDAPVPRGAIEIGVYRTKSNDDSAFYRVGSFTNEPFLAAIIFNDEMTDADLAGQPTLYTTGGVIENGTPPSANLLTTHRNRAFAVDSTDPLTLWYTKAAGPGAPAEFTPDFTTQVDPRGGDVTAIASLDDKLIVFKRASIFAITGQGQDDLGQNNDLSDAVLVTTDAGCVNPRSIALTTEGLVFQSAKGFRMLSRSLSVEDIGYDVDGYKDVTVTSSELLEDCSQVRLTLASGEALVYDYEVRQWSVFTPVRAVDAALWRGRFCYLRSDGTVMRETPGAYTDAGSFIRLRLKTAWLQLAQMQGFQRIYKALVLGSYKTPHKLRVRLAYDFNPVPSQVVDVTPEGGTAYGADAFGAGSFGGEFPLYQWRVNPSRQKCQAMQLTLEDVLDPEAGPGESMTLTGVTLEVGLKKGTNKLGADNIVG